MSDIWQLSLQFGSDHPDKQNNYKWFVIVNLPQRTVVKAPNKARLQKTPSSPRSFFFSFFFRFVLIEHVTFLFPGATFSQMVENKRDLPKKLVEPFGSSCQFESEGTRPSFYPKGKAFRERAEMQGWGWVGGLLWW